MLPHRLLSLFAALMFIGAGCAAATPTSVEPCTAPPPPADAPKILLIARERSADMAYVIDHEIGVMKCMLQKAGLNVVVASQSGKPLVAGDTNLNPDVKLSSVNVDDYAGLLLPCMAVGGEEDSIQIPSEAVEIAKAVAAQGKPMAAQDSGVLILAKAGVLDGKPYAIWTDKRPDIPGGTNQGTGVVQDGNIVTAGRCPYNALRRAVLDTTAELTQKFIALVMPAD